MNFFIVGGVYAPLERFEVSFMEPLHVSKLLNQSVTSIPRIRALGKS